MKRKQINTSRKGSRFVDKVKYLLEDRGYFVIKVSASKPFDLVAWRPFIEYALVFECRTSGSIKKALYDLDISMKKICAHAYVAMAYKSGVRFYRHEGHGHKQVEFTPLEGC